MQSIENDAVLPRFQALRWALKYVPSFRSVNNSDAIVTLLLERMNETGAKELIRTLQSSYL